MARTATIDRGMCRGADRTRAVPEWAWPPRAQGDRGSRAAGAGKPGRKCDIGIYVSLTYIRIETYVSRPGEPGWCWKPSAKVREDVDKPGLRPLAAGRMTRRPVTVRSSGTESGELDLLGLAASSSRRGCQLTCQPRHASPGGWQLGWQPGLAGHRWARRAAPGRLLHATPAYTIAHMTEARPRLRCALSRHCAPAQAKRPVAWLATVAVQVFTAWACGGYWQAGSPAWRAGFPCAVRRAALRGTRGPRARAARAQPRSGAAAGP